MNQTEATSAETRFQDLQTGEVAKNMNNKDLHEFYKNRSKREGSDVSRILQIPEGETLFVFCIIRGKTRGLRAFLDNGCNSWLVKDGVPQNELTSTKLRDGPINLGVAGGHTVQALAEWSSLLPMDNGYYQTVRGLSVADVTGNLGKIDMKPVMDELLKAARNSSDPNSKLVGKLKAPREISGETDMLIGIHFQNLFPTPIFSTPEGLTLFRSKLMPNNEGEVACIGGPSKALEKMTEMAGVSTIMSMFARAVESPESYSRKIDYFPTTVAHEMMAYKMNKMDGYNR